MSNSPLLSFASGSNDASVTFLTETLVAPTVAGAPTEGEIATATSSNAGPAYFKYNGTDIDGPATHVYYKGGGNLISLEVPSATAKNHLFASDSSVTQATAGKPTEAEIDAATVAVTDQFIYFTGTDTNTDPVTHIFHKDGAGNVKTLEKPIEVSGSETIYGKPVTAAETFAWDADDGDVLYLAFVGTAGTTDRATISGLTNFVDGATYKIRCTSNPNNQQLAFSSDFDTGALDGIYIFDQGDTLQFTYNAALSKLVLNNKVGLIKGVTRTTGTVSQTTLQLSPTHEIEYRETTVDFEFSLNSANSFYGKGGDDYAVTYYVENTDTSPHTVSFNTTDIVNSTNDNTVDDVVIPAGETYVFVFRVDRSILKVRLLNYTKPALELSESDTTQIWNWPTDGANIQFDVSLGHTLLVYGDGSSTVGGLNTPANASDNQEYKIVFVAGMENAQLGFNTNYVFGNSTNRDTSPSNGTEYTFIRPAGLGYFINTNNFDKIIQGRMINELSINTTIEPKIRNPHIYVQCTGASISVTNPSTAEWFKVYDGQPVRIFFKADGQDTELNFGPSFVKTGTVVNVDNINIKDGNMVETVWRLDASGERLSLIYSSEVLGGVDINDQTASSYIDIGNTRIQRGTASTVTIGPNIVSLPAAFANTTYTLTATALSGSTQVRSMLIDNFAKTTSTFTIACSDNSNTLVDQSYDWIAIGEKP